MLDELSCPNNYAVHRNMPYITIVPSPTAMNGAGKYNSTYHTL